MHGFSCHSTILQQMPRLRSSAGATHFYLMGSDPTMQAPQTFKEHQGTSKMPSKHRGAGQVLLMPHSSGYLEHPPLLKTLAGTRQCELISLYHTHLDSQCREHIYQVRKIKLMLFDKQTG